MLKENIARLWRMTKRAGVENLLKYLEESDFYSAPCSTKYHLAEPGGLAKHSLNVYELLFEKVCKYGLDINVETRIVCGLGHDLCKINSYRQGGEPCSDAQFNYLSNLINGPAMNRVSAESRNKLYVSILVDLELTRDIPSDHASLLIDWLKNRPQEEMPELPLSYSYDDQLPLGHGEKSISVLQNFIQLTDQEKLAIRWHMGPFTEGFKDLNRTYNEACNKCPLIVLLFTADYEASRFLEARADE